MSGKIDIIVAICASLIVIFTIIYNVKKLKKGGCNCTCSCKCKCVCGHCNDSQNKESVCDCKNDKSV